MLSRMRHIAGLVAGAALLSMLVARPRLDASPAPQNAPPAWAYGVLPADAPAPGRGGAPPPADDGSPKHLPDSTQSFTLTQIRDGFNIADWFPGDHPPMPPLVAAGRRPDVRACGLCHYPNGKGRPENAAIAGLPPAYFIQQMADFKSGLRASADRRKTNTALMTTYAKAMTDDDVRVLAEYFGSMSAAHWVRVVESAAVPVARPTGGMFVPVDGGGTEPIGARILEVPEHPDRTDLRDPRAGFVAYVPPGSLKAGEALVTSGDGGRTIACAYCHGADLNGLGPVPGIAGRSPSYLARQLFDMQAGTRHGAWTPLMSAAVARLSTNDVIAITAYAASLPARAKDPRETP